MTTHLGANGRDAALPRRAGGLVVLLAALLTFTPPAHTQTAPAREGWIAAWATSPIPSPPAPAASSRRPGGGGPAEAPASLTSETVRIVVRTTAGGSRARIRVSNFEGKTPLVVGAAHIALRQSGAALQPGTDRPLTFGGQTSISIPPGALALSDAAALDVPPQADLAVSVFFPGPVPAEMTAHRHCAEESAVVNGDATGSTALEAPASTEFVPFVVGVDVWAPRSLGAIVALGDSITDGGSRRWPAVLAARLRAAGRDFGVLNEGISGNRLLRDGTDGRAAFGISALARLERDVLSQPGVRHVILYEGINDIGHPGTAGLESEAPVTTSELVAGMRQVIARCHELGMRVYGATLTPFEGTEYPGYYSADKDAVRRAVNEWIRSGSEFDGVFDFDRALQDPTHPSRLRPEYDSGDHLHPNDAGEKALGDAVDVGLFR
jgi:lysophospholipase L1-like esterase